jgi:hypothetical protein
MREGRESGLFFRGEKGSSAVRSAAAAIPGPRRVRD